MRDPIVRYEVWISEIAEKGHIRMIADFGRFSKARKFALEFALRDDAVDIFIDRCEYPDELMFFDQTADVRKVVFRIRTGEE